LVGVRVIIVSGVCNSRSHVVFERIIDYLEQKGGATNSRVEGNAHGMPPIPDDLAERAPIQLFRPVQVRPPTPCRPRTPRVLSRRDQSLLPRGTGAPACCFDGATKSTSPDYAGDHGGAGLRSRQLDHPCGSVVAHFRRHACTRGLNQAAAPDARPGLPWCGSIRGERCQPWPRPGDRQTPTDRSVRPARIAKLNDLDSAGL